MGKIRELSTKTELKVRTIEVKLVQKGFPRFAEGQAIFSVDVVWVHYEFNSFPDESIHVFGFSRKEFSVL